MNDKEYYFFRNSEFHAACATIFSRMNYNGRSNLLQYNGFVFYMTPQHKTQENLLYSREIMVNNGGNVFAIYVT